MIKTNIDSYNPEERSVEPKFKHGDLAWSPYNGFAKVKAHLGSGYITHAGLSFSNNGFGSNEHKYPSLLTPEEAAKLGHTPPDEPKPKVKRWLWAFEDKITFPGLIVWTPVKQCLTEDQAKAHNYVKINGTETEFPS